mgnify:CR=1 FL=1
MKNYFIENNIIVDSILFGTQSNELKALSFATGGYSFACDTIEEGYKIFESDSFLSLNFRHLTPAVNLTEENKYGY